VLDAFALILVPSSATCPSNTTKKRYEATEEWHFVDIELDNPNLDMACFNHPAVAQGVPASKGPKDDCVVDKINQFKAELSNSATPDAEKLLALKFLLHFVGDVHQPLHSADDHDRGGNDKFVIFAHHTTCTKLHLLGHYACAAAGQKFRPGRQPARDRIFSEAERLDERGCWAVGSRVICRGTGRCIRSSPQRSG
jgi:hypothetical protein